MNFKNYGKYSDFSKFLRSHCRLRSINLFLPNRRPNPNCKRCCTLKWSNDCSSYSRGWRRCELSQRKCGRLWRRRKRVCLKCWPLKIMIARDISARTPYLRPGRRRRCKSSYELTDKRLKNSTSRWVLWEHSISLSFVANERHIVR